MSPEHKGARSPRRPSSSSRATTPVPSLVYPSARGVAIYPLREGASTIGRARDNDLVLSNPTVSEHHAVVIRDGDKMTIRDMLSGRTFVNETLAKSGELKPGDVLRLGEVRLRVLYAAPQAPTNLSISQGHPVPEPPPGVPLSSSGQFRTFPAKQPETQTPEPAPRPVSESGRLSGRAGSKSLARARQLSDEVHIEEDLEKLLARVANGFLEVFDADRGVCLLLEEDGRNPLLTVERRKTGSEEGTGVAREIIERSLQARTVVRIPPPGGDRRAPGGGFAAPLISGGKALGLLFFERSDQGAPFDADDVHLMAMIANQVSLAVAKLLASG
jgi:hypothetical protein